MTICKVCCQIALKYVGTGLVITGNEGRYPKFKNKLSYSLAQKLWVPLSNLHCAMKTFGVQSFQQ